MCNNIQEGIVLWKNEFEIFKEKVKQLLQVEYYDITDLAMLGSRKLSQRSH